ncbi:CIA30 family protein [Alteromonas gilva]|uniref:CIA30 family protein n=1 Tax=Alteromonas gilva TaxID=2987522 RepID=A0ABT5L5V9_9ALTE|nr:CIA30 family protein [Alteromonas gilva]MDC8832445.1 CIA30 family protein [Alteromonas gilva]
MKTFNYTVRHLLNSAACAMLLTFTGAALADTLPAVVDDFSAETNNLGLPRQHMNDSVAGGSTVSNASVSEGVLYLSGDIAPPRGQPGWASTVLLLDAAGEPQDASAYQGIRMRVKINSGNMSVSANSTEITNFDYHAAPVVVKPDGEFHVVKIPFEKLARAWSAPTALNTQTLASLSITAFEMQKGSYDFAIDEVGFY